MRCITLIFKQYTLHKSLLFVVLQGHFLIARMVDTRGLYLQGEVLSYGELDERANQLAHRLVALGVGPEVPVGVLMDRSLDLVVALLGVLKAGGAYVPMDPSYPPERLALMMEDSEVGRHANTESILSVESVS